MSLYPNPFVDVPQSDMHMLAGVAASLFAGRVALSVAETSGTQSKKVHGHPSRNKNYNMPVKRTQRKKPQRKVATVAAVKRMLSGVLEKKQLAVPLDTLFPNATSDTVLSHNITAQLTQGTTDGKRVGDEVYLNALHINGSIITDVKAGFYRFRILVGWSGEEYDPAAADITTGGLGASQVFVQNPTEILTGIVNTKAFTTLYDTILDISSQIDGCNEGQTFRTVIPLNQKFKYNGAGDKYGKTKNLYIIMVPKFFGPVTPAANIGIQYTSYVLKYSDA